LPHMKKAVSPHKGQKKESGIRKPDLRNS
jgi:hypothetical protein